MSERSGRTRHQIRRADCPASVQVRCEPSDTPTVWLTGSGGDDRNTGLGSRTCGWDGDLAACLRGELQVVKVGGPSYGFILGLDICVGDVENEAIATLENETTQTDWMGDHIEDWALIGRLAAEGVPQRQIARELAIGRSTLGAVASTSPPKYERSVQPTSFSPFEPQVRALEELEELGEGLRSL